MFSPLRWDHFVFNSIVNLIAPCDIDSMNNRKLSQHDDAKTANDWLQLELERRQAHNPMYSARAFAKQIQISPGRMSEYLNGKRQVTKNMAKKISDRLGIEPALR